MTPRNIALYSVLSAVFWLIGIYNPIKWSSLFLKADYSHVYMHVFYGSLTVLGLLARLPTHRNIARSAVAGAIVGLVSSVIAILSVELSRVSLDVMLDRIPREGGALMLAAVWSTYSVILGGPIWGAILTMTYQLLARYVPVKRKTQMEV